MGVGTLVRGYECGPRRDDLGIVVAFYPDTDGGDAVVLWQWLVCTRVEMLGGKFLRVVDD